MLLRHPYYVTLPNHKTYVTLPNHKTLKAMYDWCKETIGDQTDLEWDQLFHISHEGQWGRCWDDDGSAVFLFKDAKRAVEFKLRFHATR